MKAKRKPQPKDMVLFFVINNANLYVNIVPTIWLIIETNLIDPMTFNPAQEKRYFNIAAT